MCSGWLAHGTFGSHENTCLGSGYGWLVFGWFSVLRFVAILKQLTVLLGSQFYLPCVLPLYLRLWHGASQGRDCRLFEPD